MVSIITRGEEETEALGKKVGQRLVAGDVLAFTGGLGMGKTCFVRGLAKGMGLDANVSSPTFALVNEYRGPLPLFHFDMYRIGDLDDLYSIGFFDYLDAGGVLAIEWSEHIWQALPEHTIKVDFSRIDDQTREITLEGGDRFADLGN